MKRYAFHALALLAMYAGCAHTQPAAPAAPNAAGQAATKEDWEEARTGANQCREPATPAPIEALWQGVMVIGKSLDSGEPAVLVVPGDHFSPAAAEQGAFARAELRSEGYHAFPLPKGTLATEVRIRDNVLDVVAVRGDCLAYLYLGVNEGGVMMRMGVGLPQRRARPMPMLMVGVVSMEVVVVERIVCMRV